MSTSNAPHSRTRLEKLISVFCPLKPEDGQYTCVLALSGFVLMLGYYLIRPVREALLLSQASAEIRTYAVGSVALFAVFLVPLYGHWLRTNSAHLVFQRTLFGGILILLGFAAGGYFGAPIEIAFFVWLGLFSLLVVAQYWAVAANIFSVESGQRVLPAIAIGMSAGALMGSRLVGHLYPLLGPYSLMLVAAGMLSLHYCVQNWIVRNICERKGALDFVPKSMTRNRSKYGFALIFKNSYLLKIAILVTLLNWIDTAGDFILASSVQAYVGRLAPDADVFTLSSLIGGIYADFFFWVCVLGLLFQVLTVSKIFRTGGISAALIILPVLMVIGYSIFGFVPVFSAIYVLKILEASIDYSIQGTARHALFLPLNPVVTCHAKMTIDTFFWRFGDLIQALVVLVGLNVLNLETIHFVIINVVLALVCTFLAISVGADYRVLSGKNKPSQKSPLAEAEPQLS